MARYRYRAATVGGDMRAGTLDAASHSDVLERLRRLGLLPIEAVETKARAEIKAHGSVNAATRQAVANALGELAVLLNAGLALDRALSVTIDNCTKPILKAAFIKMRDRVKEGWPIARAMSESEHLFPPMACAMAEAGEASGKLDVTLARAAEALERAVALRQTIVSALVYPAMLLIVATGVICVMLFFVVPQFEDLFADAGNKLPLITKIVMTASDLLRSYGWVLVLFLLVLGVAIYRWLKRPSVRRTFDRNVLRVPQLGSIVVKAETARFARTLGSLVDAGVALPTALAISRKSFVNSHMGEAVGRVASGLKEGAGLSGPLAATRLFPPMAMSFLRTGEETAQLGTMLNRLADVLDREVRTALQRAIAILTPVITVMMGVVVATVIASIMSAILGFNDLAVGP
ncbi:MAG TPA: type II secretion system F family protein [Rhizomicrobium sp.]